MSMTPALREKISRERLVQWDKRLEDELATPVFLVSVGHGPHEGKVVVCAVDDVSNADLKAMLSEVVRLLPE